MSADFLLELLSEEIPARMQAKARNDLARLFAEALDGAGLAHGEIQAFSTPRRLALIVRDVAAETEAVSEELKGPRTSAPEQALAGFLKKTGLSKDELEDRDGVWFAQIDRPGQSAAAVIADAIRTIIAGFPWPKSMRWGDGELRWVRPLHSIVALLGEEVVPVEVAGISNGAITLGHRFHHPGPITIGGASDYVEKLRACHVIVDQDEREAIIRDGAARAAADAGLTLIADEGLVVENAGLTEWPVPLLGKFDPEYLDVPREVIVLTMRTNQKYFACAGEDGALAPAFVCTANLEASDGGLGVVEGNRKVLAARLADARFFWEQDLKVPLEEQAKKLDGIVFHEKLGTVADKVERVAKLVRWLVEEGVVSSQTVRPEPVEGASLTSGQSEIGASTSSARMDVEALANQAERAARLAKADLVTGMVGEFPELQGVIGGYLAAAQGEAKEVADAVSDQYGALARSAEGVALALAERIDTVKSFFDIGEKPTGSKDPFAIRRAGLGIVWLVFNRQLRFDLKALIGNDAFAFLVDRWKFQNREAGGQADLIDAVIAASADGDLGRLGSRYEALREFVDTEEGTDLLAGYKRAANILKKEEGSWTSDQVGGDDVEEAEAALVTALDAAEPNARAAIEAEDFTAAMTALASLRAPIDAFFEQVTVNADDAGVRARRLNLLARFRDAVNAVADFSKIEG